MARPREFDPDAALAVATELFWRHGYEGVTMSQLASSTGLSKSSLYAAFGDKRALFGSVVESYAVPYMAAARRALAERHVVDVVRVLLISDVEAVTHPGRPNGCLFLQGGVSVSPENADVPELLFATRRQRETELTARLVQAQQDGEIAPTADPEDLSRFVATLSTGLAVQATAGAPPAALRRIADVAVVAFGALIITGG